MIETKKKSSPLWQVGKLALVAGLLVFLSKKGFISVSAMERALTQWNEILPAFFVMTLAAVLGVFRWQWLLQAQDIHLGFFRTFELTLVGQFFNTALPGAVSGDFVKAFYIGRDLGGQRARSFGSILFDRVAGLSALVLVSACAFTLGINSFWDSPLRKGVQVFIVLATGSVLFFYAYLFLVREHHDPVLRIFKLAEARMPRLGVLARTYEALRHYHNHRITVVKVLAVSVVIHLMMGWAYLHLAQALGEMGLPLLSLYVIVPLGMLVTAVPIFPAGLGTGHAAFLYLFTLIGSQRGADVFSLAVLYNVLLSGVGGLVYLRFKSAGGPPAVLAAGA